MKRRGTLNNKPHIHRTITRGGLHAWRVESGMHIWDVDTWRYSSVGYTAQSLADALEYAGSIWQARESFANEFLG